VNSTYQVLELLTSFCYNGKQYEYRNRGTHWVCLGWSYYTSTHESHIATKWYTLLSDLFSESKL